MAFAIVVPVWRREPARPEQGMCAYHTGQAGPQATEVWEGTKFADQ